jgi:hypothetical protein
MREVYSSSLFISTLQNDIKKKSVEIFKNQFNSLKRVTSKYIKVDVDEMIKHNVRLINTFRDELP